VIWQGDKIPNATVTSTVNGLRFGKVALQATRVELVPKGPAGIRVNGHEYRGAVQMFRMRSGRVLAVNVLPLEHYLASVVDSEMPIEFGVEARRAQCIAARTYALYQMQEHRGHPYFDVYATTRSQKYLGKEYPGPKRARWAGESAGSWEIVRDTRGVVCTSNGSLFCTYFSSVCGGATSPGGDLFSDADPVLERVVCQWCRDAQLCRWTREIKWKDLLQRLNRHASTNFGESTSVTDHASSLEASRPKDKLIFRDGEESVSLTHWELRRHVLGSRLPSPLFKAERQGDRIIFHGRGHGHGAGFCQWGARGQGQAGRSFRQILEHYYPGCELVRIVVVPSDP
jgi:stage II sporulation protein D